MTRRLADEDATLATSTQGAAEPTPDGEVF